jgi:filamentous hemagglutinin family protein
LEGQISADGTLSTSVTSPDGQNFTIKDGNRAGENLYHSFSEFSVPTNGSAFFDNALDVKNSISRVTGGKVSNIDGLLRANGNASLFLLNPSGIIFGPNASLNIGGSFVASTANSLEFTDGNEFSATAISSPPLLTVNVPLGLQYSSGAAGINVQQSNLAVQPERTLALVGGNINLDGGNLTAPSGRVEIGAVAGASNVELTSANNLLQLSFANGVERADVSLGNGANVDVRAGGGGSIAINAQNLNMTGGSQLQAGIDSGLGSIGSQAGNIEINTTDLSENSQKPARASF